eukprot:7733880-Karenia_brevis.AAC.1
MKLNAEAEASRVPARAKPVLKSALRAKKAWQAKAAAKSAAMSATPKTPPASPSAASQWLGPDQPTDSSDHDSPNQ